MEQPTIISSDDEPIASSASSGAPALRRTRTRRSLPVYTSDDSDGSGSRRGVAPLGTNGGGPAGEQVIVYFTCFFLISS